MNHNTEISTIRYFDLRLERSERGVTATVTNSPAGQSSSPVVVSLPTEPVKPRSAELTPADQIALGSDLWRRLFSQSEIAELWRASNAVGGSYLRLTIGDSGLAGLPWELLYDPRTSRFVALDGQAALIRFLPLPISAITSSVDLPLRILFTGCSPAGLPRLEVDKERRLLVDALPEHVMTLVGREEAVTLSRLAADLMAGAAVWHFAGHGTEQALIFDDGAGNPASVDAFTAGMLLTGVSVRVAVINSCRGGASGGAASSIAGALLRAGVPVVVAMQSEIPDAAAIAFCKSFYHAIALGHSVEQATTAGRRVVFALGETAGASWWMPALFSRNDGPLVLANVNPADGNSLASDRTAWSQATASGGSAISKGGVAISGHVGGSVVVLSSPKS